MKLYNTWADKTPKWERRYEDSILKKYCEYGRGSTSFGQDQGYIFGAGYEMIIIAFFIGLYYNKRKPLTKDSSKVKGLRHEIRYWGSYDSSRTSSRRKPYPRLKEYIFVALVARTNIDLIALDKGEIELHEAVRMLMTTMEEYMNWGFAYIKEKQDDNPEYFYQEATLLKLFMDFIPSSNDDGDEPDSLD